jgi:hypothetical protein
MAKDPQRYRNRAEPIIPDPLGDPPEWLPSEAKADWRDFDRRLPWLNRSHRAIVEIASILQAKLRTGELGVPGMQLLRVTLGQLGATPVSACKVQMPPPVEDEDDGLGD